MSSSSEMFGDVAVNVSDDSEFVVQDWEAAPPEDEPELASPVSPITPPEDFLKFWDEFFFEGGEGAVDWLACLGDVEGDGTGETLHNSRSSTTGPSGSLTSGVIDGFGGKEEEPLPSLILPPTGAQLRNKKNKLNWVANNFLRRACFK